MFSERYIPKKREVVKQDASVKRLIVGNKQRCLTCKTFVLKIGKSSKGFANLQDRNKPYKHAADCPQEGKF